MVSGTQWIVLAMQDRMLKVIARKFMLDKLPVFTSHIFGAFLFSISNRGLEKRGTCPLREAHMLETTAEPPRLGTCYFVK